MKNKKMLVLIISLLSLSILFAQNQLEVIYEFEGEHTGSRFGESLCNVDFNGDDLDDLVIGTANWNYNIGRLYIYYGGDDFGNGPHLTISGDEDNLLDIRLRSLGDMNNDGYEDFATPNYDRNISRFKIFIYFGSAEPDTIPDYIYTPPASASINLSDFDALGDINNDGFDDMGIAEYPGDFYILWGGTTLNLELFYHSNLSYANFQTITGLGDINNDNYDDIAIEFRYDTSLFRTLLFYGGNPIDSIPDATLWDGGPGAFVNQAGDWNMDGYDDYFLRITGDVLKLYPGGEEVATQPLLNIDYFTSMLDCGDFNGDEYLDVVMGDPTHYLGDGKLFAYLGGPDLNDTIDWLITYPYSNYGLGGEVITGDYNNDGFIDIVGGAVEPSGLGRVIIFAGNEDMIDFVAVGEEVIPNIQDVTFEAYPNPFNPETTISFSIPEQCNVKISIYDIKGRKVKTIIHENIESGIHEITWDGKNKNNDHVGSGVYFYKFSINGKTKGVKKMLLLK